MSDSDDTSPPPAAAPRKRSRVAKILAIIAAVVLVLVIGALATLRYGVLLPEAQRLIEAQTEGLEVGRFGELKIEGLRGDVWHDFTIQRLTISDEEGVWLVARDVHIVWDYTALLTRRFEADRVVAEHVRVLRRPTLDAPTESAGSPIGFDIDELRARVELMPEFSYEHGVYDLRGELELLRRNRGQTGQLAIRSVEDPADRADLRFSYGREVPLILDLSAREARGGALAGALGFPADQPFLLEIDARGQEARGRFTALAETGEDRVLAASGAWTPEGGQARGRIDLTASELTRPWAERLGPQVAFAVEVAEARGPLYAIAARINAANLTATARGRVNLEERRTGPQGIEIELAVQDLSKIVPQPALGAARLVGTLRGSPEDWRFGGATVVRQAGIGDYRVDRLSGPVILAGEDGATSFDVRLTGAGGAGDGLWGALLGATPSLQVQGSRLADGRLLLRNIEAKGRGLNLEAEGRRGLLGGLSFEGEARLTNLDAARAGASGAVEASWSAVQPRPGAPWRITVDAAGRQFASGFAQLDRLLGPRPRLRGRARWEDGQVFVENAVLTGEQARATAEGLIEPGGELRLDVDWRAEGPFQVGPVEISGDARGSGDIRGTVMRPRADLQAQFDVIDIPNLTLRDARVNISFAQLPSGASGEFALTADTRYGPAQARSEFSFPNGGVRLSNLSVDAGGVQAAGSVTLARGAPSAADLQVTVTEGAFLQSGRIAGDLDIIDTPRGALMELALVAQNARLRGSPILIRNGRLVAQGPLQRLPYQVEAAGASPQGRWALDGGGIVAREQPLTTVTFQGAGRLGDRRLETVQPAVFRFGGETRTAELRLASADGGTIAVDAELGEVAADIEARATQLDLGLLNEDLAGQMNAVLNLQGRGDRLTGTLQAQLADARGRGVGVAQGLDAVVTARLNDEFILIEARASNEQGLRANADLRLPVEASADPLRLAINRQQPLQGRFFADGQVRPLWDLLVGGERTLAGHVRTEGVIRGTLADPRVVGRASVENGRFEDFATGLVLQDVELRAAFSDGVINITQAQARDGEGGRLTGSGRISLLRGGASTFRLMLQEFQLIDNEQATASATGPVTIERGPDGRVRLSGDLTIDRAEVAATPPTPTGVVTMDVTEINRPADLVRDLTPEVRQGPGWALDVELNAPGRVFLRGRGLDVEMSLDAHVGGTTNQPVLSGQARVVRGEYDFAGRRFEFSPRSVVYLATSPERIRLDLTAVREDPTLTAEIRIQGTAAEPEVELASTPSLPDDEILSQVLFGRSAAQLSALEAAQLASALSAMTGGGGFDLIGGLRNFAGLDRLRFAGGDESGVMVAGGKYLTDDVYLELIGGGREGPAVQVEWRVRRNLAVISRLTGQGDSRLSVRWRRSY